MKFTNLLLAYSYADRAFETNGKSLMVLMGECTQEEDSRYLVVTYREANRLLKQGHEIAPRL